MRIMPIVHVAALVGLVCGGCDSTPAPKITKVDDSRASDLNNAYSTPFDSDKTPEIKNTTRIAAARVSETRGDSKQAIRQYESVLANNPTDAEASESLFRLGVLNTELKQYDAAREHWQKYINKTGGSATAYANLGFCYQTANLWDNAMVSYQLGLERDPGNRACRVNLGLLLAQQGKYADAEAELKKVLKPAEVWYNLGSAAELRPDQDFARKAYERALKLDPTFSPAMERIKAMSRPTAKTE